MITKLRVHNGCNNVEDGDLDDIIFNLSSDCFGDVGDSTDLNSGVDVSVLRDGVVGVNSEIAVVVSSNSVALSKVQTKKNLFNCIEKFVFALWESRKDLLFNSAAAGGVNIQVDT
eukprot:Awhi_evm2s9247